MNPVFLECNSSHSAPQSRCFARDKDAAVTQATHYFEISFDFMQIMDGDGEDEKLMGDFGKHDELLSTGLINS